MKEPWTPIVFLVAGVALLSVALYVALNLAVALLLLVLAAAAFIASLVTRSFRPSPSGRTALTVGAATGIVLVLLGFAAIYFSYWFRSVGG